MSDLYNTHTLAAVEMLNAWGIDPYECYADGFGETGYLTRRVDSFGRTVLVEHPEGGMQMELDANDWPKGFPVEEFLRHITAIRVGERAIE